MTTAQDLPSEFIDTSRAFTNRARDLRTRTHRAGAVLRLLQFRFMHETNANKVGMDDVQELVDLTLEALPHHDNDLYDPLDDFDHQSRRAVIAANASGNRLATILEAMTIAARFDSTLPDLEAAAKKVFDIAEADDAYEPDWRSFREALESRGYLVEVVTIEGICLGPSVTTPDIKAMVRKVAARQRAFVAAVQESSAARQQATPPGPAQEKLRPRKSK